jgi:hypothetical protein
MLKNIPNPFKIMGGYMIPDIGVGRYQTGFVLAVYNFKRANEGVDVFTG